MSRINSLICVTLLALLGGCTGGTPSEVDARQEYEKTSRWSGEIKNGVVKVLSFKKVNGQPGEFMGIKFYSMDYEAELEFLKNRTVGFCITGREQDGFCNAYNAGDKVSVNGGIGFIKTEKGWRGKKSGTDY